jgi:hypothetical protein
MLGVWLFRCCCTTNYSCANPETTLACADLWMRAFPLLLRICRRMGLKPATCTSGLDALATKVGCWSELGNETVHQESLVVATAIRVLHFLSAPLRHRSSSHQTKQKKADNAEAGKQGFLTSQENRIREHTCSLHQYRAYFSQPVSAENQ